MKLGIANGYLQQANQHLHSSLTPKLNVIEWPVLTKILTKTENILKTGVNEENTSFLQINNQHLSNFLADT